MPRVPITELPELVRALASYDGENNLRRREITRDALMFTLLTWARTGETRFATWHEFEGLDSPQPLWRIAPRIWLLDHASAIDRRQRSLRSFPAKDHPPVGGCTIVDSVRRACRRSQGIAADRDQSALGELAPLQAHQADARSAGFAAVERNR